MTAWLNRLIGQHHIQFIDGEFRQKPGLLANLFSLWGAHRTWSARQRLLDGAHALARGAPLPEAMEPDDSALDPLLAHADLWLHGHLHCCHDYRVGRCRVVANPMGYAEKGEQRDFRPAWCVELPVPDPLGA